MLEIRPGEAAVRFMAEGKEGDFRVGLPLEPDPEAVAPDQLLYRYYLIQGFRTLHTLIKRAPRQTVGRLRWKPADGILQWLLPTGAGRLLTMISPPSDQAILNGGYRRLYRGQRHVIPAMRPKYVDPVRPADDVCEDEAAWRRRVDAGYARCQAAPRTTNITKDQFEQNLRQLEAASDGDSDSDGDSSSNGDGDGSSDGDSDGDSDPAFREGLELLAGALDRPPRTPSPSPPPPVSHPGPARPPTRAVPARADGRGGGPAPEAPPLVFCPHG